MTTITASGTSTSYTPAERATIRARISIESPDRQRSVSISTQLHTALLARAVQLREHGDATWHAAEPLSTAAQLRYPNGTNKPSVTSHLTTSTISVKLANLEIVALIVDEFTRAGAEVTIDWALTEASKREREREARKAAVGDARAVAEDYASALGERITEVVSISDRGVSGTHYNAAPRFAAAMSSEAPAEVTIKEITVSASVEGIFASHA